MSVDTRKCNEIAERGTCNAYIRANKIRLYQNLRLLSTPGLYVNVSNLHFFDEIDSTHNSNRIYSSMNCPAPLAYDYDHRRW